MKIKKAKIYQFDQAGSLLLSGDIKIKTYFEIDKGSDGWSDVSRKKAIHLLDIVNFRPPCSLLFDVKDESIGFLFLDPSEFPEPKKS